MIVQQQQQRQQRKRTHWNEFIFFLLPVRSFWSIVDRFVVLLFFVNINFLIDVYLNINNVTIIFNQFLFLSFFSGALDRLVSSNPFGVVWNDEEWKRKERRKTKRNEMREYNKTRNRWEYKNRTTNYYIWWWVEERQPKKQVDCWMLVKRLRQKWFLFSPFFGFARFLSLKNKRKKNDDSHGFHRQ